MAAVCSATMATDDGLVRTALTDQGRLQLGGYLRAVRPLRHSTWFQAAGMPDPDWNHAVSPDLAAPADAVVVEVEEAAVTAGLAPAFYVEPSWSASLREALSVRGYTAVASETWMSFSGLAPAARTPLEIRVARNASDLETFARVLDRADGHEEGEPLSPFGRAILRASPSPGARFVRLLGSHEGRVVSIASLHFAGDAAGLYDVATLPDLRGRGFSTTVVVEAVRRVRAARCRRFWLQTTTGSDAERLYRKLGFVEAFVGEAWAPA